MHRHRFLEQLSSSRSVSPAGLPTSGFLMCPAALWQGAAQAVCPWQQVCQLAYEQARAVVQLLRLERLQPVSWN